MSGSLLAGSAVAPERGTELVLREGSCVLTLNLRWVLTSCRACLALPAGLLPTWNFCPSGLQPLWLGTTLYV